MKLSIIIPAYNAERSLHECLNSVLSDVTCCEIIVINDGSTDKTEEICSAVASNQKNVILLNQENAGVSSARNTGLEIATGTYVMFMDSDDCFEAHAIDIILEAIKTEPDIISYGYKITKGENETVFIDKEYPKLNNGYRFLNEVIKDGTSSVRSVWRFAYRRDIINSIGLRFDTTMTWAEDYDFNLRYFQHVDSVLQISKALYRYRTSDQSVTHRPQMRGIKSELKMALHWLSSEPVGTQYKYIRKDLAVLYSSAVYLLSCCTNEENTCLNQSLISLEILLETRRIKYILLYTLLRLTGNSGLRLLRIMHGLF